MRVVMDEAALRRLLADPNGGLANDRRRRAQNVRRKQQADLKGRTRAGVVIRERPSPDGPVLQIGVWRRSEKEAPPEVFEGGAKAHRIYPRNAKALAFNWPKVGGRTIVPAIPGGRGGWQVSRRGGRVYVITKGYVDHPGMAPRYVFSRSLDAARR